MRTLECSGVLFDLDGVLVDSARVVVRTWHTWAGQKGLDAGRFIEIAHGRRPAETAPPFDKSERVEGVRQGFRLEFRPPECPDVGRSRVAQGPPLLGHVCDEPGDEAVRVLKGQAVQPDEFVGEFRRGRVALSGEA